ncbi:hypothetical protein AVEN_51408-1 [Araneus ventricosus]|uniref:Uncharacterized protein n=1 Tax=Araneus ventricosus TaxID=182803 RepID=A0A4Y2LS31_ARAVE|nr:hypothetical protein AVEN_51408-1 [Araneus ventricosus]
MGGETLCQKYNRKANIRSMSLLHEPHMPIQLHLPKLPAGVPGPSRSQGKAQTDWKAIDLGQPQYVTLPCSEGPLPPLGLGAEGVALIYREHLSVFDLRMV